jgi:hypothetical protein
MNSGLPSISERIAGATSDVAAGQCGCDHRAKRLPREFVPRVWQVFPRTFVNDGTGGTISGGCLGEAHEIVVRGPPWVRVTWSLTVFSSRFHLSDFVLLAF